MSELGLIIFGGTTEGRLLAEFCAENGIVCEVSVATDYGASLLPSGVTVHTGRLDSVHMTEFIISGGFTLAADATHPYAKEATANIITACKAADIPCLRLLRETSEVKGTAAESMEQLIEILNGCGGNILCTLGSKALPELTAVRDFRERMWVRVLPSEGIREYCAGLGFDAEKVICAKGPFSAEENLRDIALSRAELLVTKESGAAGGYPEKAEAAERAGIGLVTLTRPREQGLTLEEMKAELIRRKETMR